MYGDISYHERGDCSWYEFSRAILEEAGVKGIEVLPIKSDQFPRLAKRPCFSVLNDSKFYQTTGIAIKPWRIAFQDCLPKIIGVKRVPELKGNGSNKPKNISHRR
ncbi:MAG: hypothetical protein C0399_11995 [Syntrophus sp. (in: bacteria)]|nr:hypothetical protein [Syntrophus sp. (in: bacteria)]